MLNVVLYRVNYLNPRKPLHIILYSISQLQQLSFASLYSSRARSLPERARLMIKACCFVFCGSGLVVPDIKVKSGEITDWEDGKEAVVQGYVPIIKDTGSREVIEYSED